ncbi:MAG: PAS domain S-box protein, partial [Proteobacteria bacterium]|nr:PAS domain S-box protein [Pseudomonadota bacterium]
LPDESFRLLVENVRDYGLFMLDREGRIATWNVGAQRIKGYVESEVVGRHFSLFYPPEDVAAAKPQRGLEIAARDGKHEDQGWRLRKDGSRFYADIVITALFNPAGELVGFGKLTRDVTERRRAEEQQRLLLDELNHRVKNTLATVQSIAAGSARDTASVEDFRRSFDRRLVALSQAHDLLTRTSWESAELDDIVRQTLAPYLGRPGVVLAEGPSVRLSPKAVVAVHMGLHEMATNAAKYGALAYETGRLEVGWRIVAGEPPSIIFDWRESGVPGLQPPSREGFGTRLIKAVGRELDARVEPRLQPDGMSFRWTAHPSEKIAF